MKTRKMAVALAAGLSLCLPAAAQADTKLVDMGLPFRAHKAFNGNEIHVNDYFPHRISIHQGDSVKFQVSDYHTVDLPARGTQPLSLVSPTGFPVRGSNDAAGNPFWFNGQTGLNVTLALLQLSFGKKLVYDGSQSVRSGAPVGKNPKPMTVRFPRTGSFTYYCDIHTGMKGQIRVLPRNRAIPSKTADRRRAAREIARDFKIGKRLKRSRVPARTINVGTGGKYGVEYFNFLPRSRTVPVGTTLTFRMTRASSEDHTATTGPGDPLRNPSSYLGMLAASLNAAYDPAAAFPSDPPGTVATLTPASHGNGFWNSGIMDSTARTPLPASGKVTFGAPGTYDFYCLVHPFMHGRIRVR